jgi:hypothetical protein
VVGVDIPLIRKYAISLQELPSLCLHLFLEGQTAAGRAQQLTFTEAAMAAYADRRTAAQLALEERKMHRNPPPRGSGMAIPADGSAGYLILATTFGLQNLNHKKPRRANSLVSVLTFRNHVRRPMMSLGAAGCPFHDFIPRGCPFCTRCPLHTVATRGGDAQHPRKETRAFYCCAKPTMISDNLI